MEEEENIDNQPKSNGRGDVRPLLPYQWKKGQSGNPQGRPKGKTAKERAREYLLAMTDDEFDDFLAGMNKKDIWEMAEGKPKQETEHSGSLTISEVLDNLQNE